MRSCAERRYCRSDLRGMIPLPSPVPNRHPGPKSKPPASRSCKGWSAGLCVRLRNEGRPPIFPYLRERGLWQQPRDLWRGNRRADAPSSPPDVQPTVPRLPVAKAGVWPHTRAGTHLSFGEGSDRGLSRGRLTRKPFAMPALTMASGATRDPTRKAGAGRLAHDTGRTAMPSCPLRVPQPAPGRQDSGGETIADTQARRSCLLPGGSNLWPCACA